MKFTHECMQTILSQLNEHLLEHNEVIFDVLNPDMKHTFAGEKLYIDGAEYIYRSLKSWMDLSELLQCKMHMPKVLNDTNIQLHFSKLDVQESFHEAKEVEEKYGEASEFSKIHKNEEPAFLHYYVQALKNVNVAKRMRILNLGVNDADEFEVIESYVSNFEELELVGLDYCESAVQKAKEKFPSKNVSFVQGDINHLEALDLGTFDLIISIGTLQSSNLQFNKVLMNVVQNHLNKDGAMILGFPNCRWLDGQMIYGAKIKNYAFSELSNVFKDAQFCKKYLQQKKFRVTLTGKHYIFLTATSIRK